MAGSISNVGISLSGTSSLNADLIDKLRESEKTSFLKPTEKQLEKTFSKQEDYKQLLSKLQVFQKSSEVFSDEMSYLKRKVSVAGDGAEVTAADGVDPQSGYLSITQIAKQSVIQSKGFPSSSSIINSAGNKVLNFKSNGQEFKFDITPGMTLEDLKWQINDSTNGQVTASILNTGGSDGNRLILKSKGYGEDAKVEILSDAENSLDLGIETIQESQDAKFTYNGVEITRTSNTVDDLFIGVTIELKKDNSDVNFNITRNLDNMTEKMQEFADNYNEVTAYIGEITGYDTETNKAGNFQGDYRVSSIQSSINSFLFKFTKDGESMSDYGMSLTKEGTLMFDSFAFQNKLENDPTGFERFLRGSTDITPTRYVSKPIGYEYSAHTSTNKNGTQVTNFIEKPFSEDISIAKGSIKINDIELDKFDFLASNSPSQNAMLLVSAINAKTDMTGVTATISTNGKQVLLTDETGEPFTIKTNGGIADRVGIASGTYRGKQEEVVGIFADVSSFFDELIDGETSTLGLLNMNLKKDEERLTDEIQATLDRLNSKYDLMALQFTEYNKVISGFEAAFKGVQMQIDAMASQK